MPLRNLYYHERFTFFIPLPNRYPACQGIKGIPVLIKISSMHA